MGKGRKHIKTHVRWFLSLYLSKETKGQVSVCNPKLRSNLTELGVRKSPVATMPPLNYVE